MEKTKKRLSPWAIVLISGFALCAVLNILAWISTGFADFYTDNIFVYISVPFSFLTSLLPFSFGEILIIIGILIVLIGIPTEIIFLIKYRKNREKRSRLLKGSALFLCWVIFYILLTETLNCFIQYHCTTFSDKYYPEYAEQAAQGYTVEQLTELCDYIIDNANELSEQVERDENGEIIIPENAAELAGEYVRALAEEYPRFGGWYTVPKDIACSRTMSKLNLQGIYFPFTMEANINKDMRPSRKPVTMCHELAHTKGFILEDEAGFISYLACINSGDALFMYSGYLCALNYSVNQLFRYVSEEEKIRIAQKIGRTVYYDNTFLTEEYKASLEKDKIIKTETAAKVSDKAMTASLKLNGVSDGKQSYSRIVDLLLEYYYYVM
ncbi:MAG: DUF3810 domain-containing protein [Oscillospiraceae bacterium]|nr:DUF3810 domain-containing protein [Oscillospiraceae bacterium]